MKNIICIYVLSNCECKFDSRKCNSNENWNNNKCWYKCKNSENDCICEKGYI